MADFSAGTVLQQLGGRRFIAMTGAKRFVKNEKKNWIAFNLPKGKDGIRFVHITLNVMDTYDIDFKTMSGKLVKRVTGVYNDQLQEVFTENTGLYTSLGGN